ncbi:hypothetical protein TSUD_87460 [Trifolium subterraneum]|uniref:Cyclin-dependent protein kinase inhibitor SMR3 n=1 Tax=Trifolium subterraneum TaxID=3900 RepID=A0A2Z6NKC0_TRISU|nr:hypothetical protein TSUD_87460 [Trifolium subterraneum]
MEVHDQELKPKQNQVQQNDQEKQRNNVPFDLKINIPTYDEKKDQDDDSLNDGFKTPTNMENKIQVILPPPPPRKAKQVFRPSTKRKGCFHRPQVVLDLSQEIDSLFSTIPLDLDLGPNGKNHKKVKLF